MRKTRNILRVKSNKNSYKRIDKAIVKLFKKNTKKTDEKHHKKTLKNT